MAVYKCGYFFLIQPVAKIVMNLLCNAWRDWDIFEMLSYEKRLVLRGLASLYVA